MCEEKDKGLVAYTAVSRRRFAALSAAAAAAGLATTASAQTRPVTERDVSVPTPDGTVDAALFHPAGAAGRWSGVLFWPDAGGLRPAMRDMGRRLAAPGDTGVVVNPYYRTGAAAAVAQTAMDRERRGSLRASLTSEAVARDARAYVGFLDSLPQTSRARMGVQGYCMGGALAFRTAAAAPERIGAVGSFHGGGLVSEDADSPHRLIGKTRASYLVAVAKNDDAREPNAKTVLRETFASAKRPAVVEVYGGDHGWCVPDNGAYDQAEAERAWAALIRLYAEAL
jgi:carboxymethylenebutenolidase